jgi:pyruvate/2-oxoglutarate dehydrogenase complex dihydrolipoamide acyltransferase (E2) component
MGMYTEEGVLSAWLRPAGARVEAGEAIVEITTEKVTFEVPSPAAGILHHVAEPGANLSVEALLGYVLAEGEALPSVAEPENAGGTQRDDGSRKSPAAGESPRTSGMLRASPAAKRLAAHHGIDLKLVKGSGPGGRIVEADVLAKVSQPRT